MKKNILIGICICAVVLLALGSLNNVVGYQLVQSSTNEKVNIQCDCKKDEKKSSVLPPGVCLGLKIIYAFLKILYGLTRNPTILIWLTNLDQYIAANCP